MQLNESCTGIMRFKHCGPPESPRMVHATHRTHAKCSVEPLRRAMAPVVAVAVPSAYCVSAAFLFQDLETRVYS